MKHIVKRELRGNYYYRGCSTKGWISLCTFVLRLASFQGVASNFLLVFPRGQLDKERKRWKKKKKEICIKERVDGKAQIGWEEGGSTINGAGNKFELSENWSAEQWNNFILRRLFLIIFASTQNLTNVNEC